MDMINNRPTMNHQLFVSKQSEYYKSLDIKDFPVECWRSILGFPRYKVSNYGRVKTLNRQNRGYEAIITPNMTASSSGYVMVQLFHNNKPKTFQVHRLVAQAFLFNPYNKPEVNHKNGVKTDNTIGNLEWCTRSENLKHAADVLDLNTGVKHFRSKFTEKDVIDIYNAKGSYKYIGNLYGVSSGTVNSIKNKKSYKTILNGLN